MTMTAVVASYLLQYLLLFTSSGLPDRTN